MSTEPKAGRPTNTERINKNRDEITENEDAIEKIRWDIARLQTQFQDTTLLMQARIENLEKLRLEVRSALKSVSNEWKDSIKRLEDAFDKSFGELRVVVDDRFKLQDELEKKMSAAEITVKMMESSLKDFATKEEFNLLRSDTNGLNDNTAKQQESIWKWVSKVKSDYEVHSSILIALGVATAANLAFVAWYFLGK